MVRSMVCVTSADSPFLPDVEYRLFGVMWGMDQLNKRAVIDLQEVRFVLTMFSNLKHTLFHIQCVYFYVPFQIMYENNKTPRGKNIVAST